MPPLTKDLEQRARYTQTQRLRGVPFDTINALHVFSFPALLLIGHQKVCMSVRLLNDLESL